MLMDTDAGTGFMHESFHKDDPKNFTRARYTNLFSFHPLPSGSYFAINRNPLFSRLSVYKLPLRGRQLPIHITFSWYSITGFMHESFHKDDPKNFTRAWFAWQNTLFGELILNVAQGIQICFLSIHFHLEVTLQ